MTLQIVCENLIKAIGEFQDDHKTVLGMIEECSRQQNGAMKTLVKKRFSKMAAFLL